MNLFTYPDVAGKRHLRRYVKAALLIVFVLGIIAIYAGAQRQEIRSVLEATPVSVADILPSWTPSPEPVQPSATPTPNPDVTPTAPPCPTDPEEWTLADLFTSQNYKRIYPDCVYDGLARTVAWTLASDALGYTRIEAAQALGFSEPPSVIDTDGLITGMTDTRGPMPISVHYSPIHPDLRSWNLDENIQPNVTYTLRGCYRTYTITGTEKNSWGDYPVICTFSVDVIRSWMSYDLNGLRVVSGGEEIKMERTYSMFGYAGDGLWLSIGKQADASMAIEDLGQIDGDRRFVRDQHAIDTPWDAAWLYAAYGLSVQPLPADWQSYTDPAAIQAILDEMSAYQVQTTGDGP